MAIKAKLVGINHVALAVGNIEFKKDPDILRVKSD